MKWGVLKLDSSPLQKKDNDYERRNNCEPKSKRKNSKK